MLLLGAPGGSWLVEGALSPLLALPPPTPAVSWERFPLPQELLEQRGAGNMEPLKTSHSPPPQLSAPLGE